MTLPLQVTFRNMKHSPQVEDWIRAEAEKLETFYHRITACRVAIEVPHRHHKKGKPIHIRIDLTLPGKGNCHQTRARCDPQDYCEWRIGCFESRAIQVGARRSSIGDS